MFAFTSAFFSCKSKDQGVSTSGVISNAKALSKFSFVAGRFACIGGRASAATEHRAIRC